MEPEAAGQLLAQDSTISTAAILFSRSPNDQFVALTLWKTEYWSLFRVLLLIGVLVITRDDWALFLAELVEYV